VTDFIRIAAALNRQTANARSPRILCPTIKNHMLSDIVLTRDIVLNKLSKLKVNKAPGVRWIST